MAGIASLREQMTPYQIANNLQQDRAYERGNFTYRSHMTTEEVLKNYSYLLDEDQIKTLVSETSKLKALKVLEKKKKKELRKLEIQFKKIGFYKEDTSNFKSELEFYKEPVNINWEGNIYEANNTTRSGTVEARYIYYVEKKLIIDMMNFRSGIASDLGDIVRFMQGENLPQLPTAGPGLYQQMQNGNRVSYNGRLGEAGMRIMNEMLRTEMSNTERESLYTQIILTDTSLLYMSDIQPIRL